MIYPKGSIGYYTDLAKKDGFDNYVDWLRWRKENGKISDYTRIDREKNERIAKNAGYESLAKYNRQFREQWAIDKGYDNFSEYVKDHIDIWAQNKGYDSYNERRNERDWENGKRVPMSENEDCSLHFGVFKGEEVVKRYLETIFEYVEHMHPTYRQFDFICRNIKQEFVDKYSQLGIEKNKEYRIQVKVTSLIDNHFCFTINYNKNIDFFILIGFDNKDNLNTINMWLIEKEEMIRVGIGGTGYTLVKAWNRKMLNIYMNTKSQMSYIYFKKYELNDEIEKLNKICKKFKEEI